MTDRLRRWATGLFEPVDAASMAVFRIVLGAMIAWDVVRYAQEGWIYEYYIRPKYHFTYLYFDWVQPWPGNGMYIHFAVMGVAAAMVAAGLFYRAAIVLLWFLYTYKFLLEQSVYMNHYYLISLLCFLLIWMSPHRAFSLDRLRHPEWSEMVPRWNILLLRFQLFIVYFFGAIAKLNPDWLRGEPMYSSLVNRSEGVPEIASYLSPALLAYGIAYGGLLFDAIVPVLLCFRRSRLIGFALATAFHAMNEIFLRIGVFSYLMTGAITIFFDPDWPRRLHLLPPRAAAPQESAQASAGVRARRVASVQWALLLGIAAYVAVQIALPLRHFLYPGYVSWTEEGHRFAWHMKLRGKSSRMQIVAYIPETGQRMSLDPAKDLTHRQLKKLYTFPDMLLRYVHFKRDEIRASGMGDPVIKVDWRCSLNGLPPRRLVDPDVDLAQQERSLWPATWILRGD
ncbi:MAG: HTTM domain-containing protein [Candidatus Binatia bacterium]